MAVTDIIVDPVHYSKNLKMLPITQEMIHGKPSHKGIAMNNMKQNLDKNQLKL